MLIALCVHCVGLLLCCVNMVSDRARCSPGGLVPGPSRSAVALEARMQFTTPFFFL